MNRRLRIVQVILRLTVFLFVSVVGIALVGCASGRLRRTITGGSSYYQEGNYDRALEEFSRAIELNPQFALAFNNRGAVLVDLGDYKLALADYNMAIELDPQYVYAYYLRGLSYEELNETLNASVDLNRVLELSDDPWLRKQAEEQLRKLELSSR